MNNRPERWPERSEARKSKNLKHKRVCLQFLQKFFYSFTLHAILFYDLIATNSDKQIERLTDLLTLSSILMNSWLVKLRIFAFFLQIKLKSLTTVQFLNTSEGRKRLEILNSRCAENLKQCLNIDLIKNNN